MVSAIVRNGARDGIRYSAVAVADIGADGGAAGHCLSPFNVHQSFGLISINTRASIGKYVGDGRRRQTEIAIQKSNGGWKISGTSITARQSLTATTKFRADTRSRGDRPARAVT